MKTIQLLSYPLLLVVIGVLAGCTSGSPAVPDTTPPVTLPSPVLGLISVSSPNQDGIIEVQGDAGAVAANTTVTVNNAAIDASASALIKGITSDGDADANGEFVIQIQAEVGQMIEISYATDNETSETGAREVLDNHPLINEIPKTIGVSPSQDRAFVFFEDGFDSFIDIFDLTDNSFESSLTVEDIQCTDATFDDVDGQFYIVGAPQDSLAIVEANGDLLGGSRLSVTTPLTVATTPDGAFALLGNHDELDALTLVADNDGNPQVIAVSDIQHPDNATLEHDMSYSLSFDTDASDNLQVAILSTFVDGNAELADAVLTIATITDNITINEQLSLGDDAVSGRGAFETVVLFNNATELLISNRSTDQILRLETDGVTITETLTIAVDQGPIGIALDEATNQAFSANAGESTVSIIDLATNTVSSTLDPFDGLGIGPTYIAMDPDPLTLIINNSETPTASFLEIP